MATPSVFAFERIDDALEYMPLAARRVLDVLGWKLSLEGWLSLAPAQRAAVVRAGAEPTTDPAAAAIVGEAAPAASRVTPQADPDASSVPEHLRVALAALVPARPIESDRWGALRPLDRYALIKCANRPEKLSLAYDEIVGLPLTHMTRDGRAVMVDVGSKAETHRRAVASARVSATRAAIDAIAAGALPKGDAFAAARIAGIMAAKRTAELVPLCHPVRTTRAAVDFEVLAGEIRVRATVEAVDRTGVEMEAMVAASVAALTLYDMIKSADRWATIESLRLDCKSGGKSGEVSRPLRARSPVTASSEVASPMAGVWVELRDTPLSVDEAISHVKAAGAGAICVFLGTVRDHNDGRSVVMLEYQAYAAMAVVEMRRIADEIAAETPGARLAVAHRVGALGIGDVAVVCAASAPHRDEAYRACRALIDRVKARAPIWKREHGPDGAYWVGWEDARCEGEHGHHVSTSSGVSQSRSSSASPLESGNESAPASSSRRASE
jgi:molybdopterin synthase catalytic subunit